MDMDFNIVIEIGGYCIFVLFVIIGMYGHWRRRLISPKNLNRRMWLISKSDQWWMRYLERRWPSKCVWIGAFGLGALLLARPILVGWVESVIWPIIRAQFDAVPLHIRWIIGGSIVFVALIVILILPKSSIRESPGGELGAAHFLDPLKTTEWGDVPKGSGIDPSAPNPVLAYLLVVAPTSLRARLGLVPARREDWTLLPLRAQQLNQDILVVGMPGTGKTTKVFNPILLTASVPIIYNDPKASLPLWQKRPNACVWGFDTRGYRSRSSVWNPLEELRSKDDIDWLSAVLFPDRHGDKDPWVRSGARDLLEGFLNIRKTKGWKSLSEIVDWTLANSQEIWAKELGPTYVYSAQDPKKFSAITDEFKTCMKAWAKPRARAITSGPSTVRLNDFIKNGGYVMAAEKEENKGPLKVFWALLIERLKDRPEGSSQIILALDELGDAGAIPDLPNALSRLRSRGVAVVAGIQSFSLLKRTYREDAEAVRDGFGLRFFYLENFPDNDRLDLSKWVGTRSLQRQAKKGEPPPQPFAAPLLPVDAIGAWGDSGALLARGNRWTWWHPVQIVLPDSPREVLPTEEENDENLSESVSIVSESEYNKENDGGFDSFGL